MYYHIVVNYIVSDNASPKLMVEEIRCTSYNEFIQALSTLDYPPVKVTMEVKFF